MMFILGKILGYLYPKKYDVHFFIPHMGYGGAEQVHLVILKTLFELNKKVIIFLDGELRNDLKKKFCNYAQIYDFRSSNKNRNYFFFALGFIATIINNNKRKKILYGSHSYLFYRTLPFINKNNCKIVDHIHNLEYDGSVRYAELFINISKYIDTVLCVENVTQNKIKELTNHENVTVLQNPTSNEFFKIKKSKKLIKKAVYVGRDDLNKRTYLLKELSETTDWEYGWVGNVELNINILADKITFYGLISNRSDLAQIMSEYSVLLLLSKFEAFPMVIQEAMALGLLVISTNVGAISSHIQNNYNGILLNATEDEEIIQEVKTKLESLTQQKFEILTNNARKYAKDNFSINKFNNKIQSIFE